MKLASTFLQICLPTLERFSDFSGFNFHDLYSIEVGGHDRSVKNHYFIAFLYLTCIEREFRQGGWRMKEEAITLTVKGKSLRQFFLF